MRMSGNLLNGITSRQRRVTNDDAANPRPTLTHGHPRTSGGSGSVPGGRHCIHAPAVSRVSNRDHIAWAANTRMKPEALKIWVLVAAQIRRGLRAGGTLMRGEHDDD